MDRYGSLTADIGHEVLYDIMSTPSSPSTENEGFDKREVLVDVLKTAIPASLGNPFSKLEPSQKWTELRKDKKDAKADFSKKRLLNKRKVLQVEERIERIRKPIETSSPPKEKGKRIQGMRSSELTPEIRRDLEVLSMRGSFHPKRHYKVRVSFTHFIFPLRMDCFHLQYFPLLVELFHLLERG